MILEAAGTVEAIDDDGLREDFLTTLRQGAVALSGIATGFGRRGLAGKWSNAFGSVILTPDGNDAWHLAIDMRVDYGSNRRRQCQLSTAVTRSGGWLNGEIASTTIRPAKPPEVKLRRQGETLRVVMHPAWDKRDPEMHATADARAHVDGLQRERIALLEGFDDKRTSLAGVWLAYNAIIRITVDEDGRLKAKGWKWDQGDWKSRQWRLSLRRAAKVPGHAGDAMLVVNRLDDVFAKRRSGKDGADESKCRRRLDSSSTALLFPARDSPDIDNFSGSIR